MIFTAVDPILVRKVREPYGWLGNMSPHPITFAPELGGERWRTAEALFQATRFGVDTVDVRRQIREALSPVEAKRIARRHASSMVVTPRSPEDVIAMHLVLLMKLNEHPELLRALLDTADRLDGAGSPRGAWMIRAEAISGRCSACGKAQRVIALTIGTTTVMLCRECSRATERTIGDKLSILNSDVPPNDQVTANVVASFATYPHGLLLDELVMCTVRYNIGPLDADERRIATALLERLATLGIARKVHRPECEIWPKYRLCNCPWEVPS